MENVNKHKTRIALLSQRPDIKENQTFNIRSYALKKKK